MSPFIADPQAVAVFAPKLGELSALLDALAPHATGDVFCAAPPPDEEDEEFAQFLADDEFPYYSATVSDTVATFVVEIERGDPASAQTRYEVHVTDSGPGADRLRYRIAKTVIAVTGGTVYDANGLPAELTAPEQDPFGSLW
jgi:hypothetical protein